MKFILIKVDKGDVWGITGTTVQTDDFVVDETVMEIDNKNLFDYIKERIVSAEIQVSKKIKGKLIKEDLIEIEYDTLHVYKERMIHKGREYLSTRLNVATLFDYVDFIMANNVLVSNGYFITPLNKRESFLKIIESDNQDLLQAIDTYTSIESKLTVTNGWWKTYKDFEQKVYNAKDVTEVDDKYKIFVQIFG